MIFILGNKKRALGLQWSSISIHERWVDRKYGGLLAMGVSWL